MTSHARLTASILRQKPCLVYAILRRVLPSPDPVDAKSYGDVVREGRAATVIEVSTPLPLKPGMNGPTASAEAASQKPGVHSVRFVMDKEEGKVLQVRSKMRNITQEITLQNQVFNAPLRPGTLAFVLPSRAALAPPIGSR